MGENKNFVPIGKRISFGNMKDKETLSRLKDWTTFYRNNIHIFINHYMGVHLYLYQKIWVYLISKSMKFLGYASRASAKSWIIGVYSVARCILYPGTGIALVSSVKKQAGLIVEEKIEPLANKHPNIAREIKSITTNNNKYEVEFWNGSKIFAVVSKDSGRGNRANIIVLEERRLIDIDAIRAIIRPFLVTTRGAPYADLPEYRDIPDVGEETQEIAISSVHYKSGEWYRELVRSLSLMASGNKDIRAVFLDYLISLKHRIKTRKTLAVSKEDDTEINFSMEYGNIPYGGSSKSFFNIGFFDRKIKEAWRPARKDVPYGENPYNIERKDGEIRIVVSDIATAAGKENDNTIILCARLFPTKRGYRTDVVYIESFNGENSVTQVRRIKQIYYEFSGYHKDDILVLDVANAGRSIYDMLTKDTYDEFRDIEYDAMMVMETQHISSSLYEDLYERSLTKDGHPCIFPIIASSEFNSSIAYILRDRLKKKMVNFIVEDMRLEEHLITRKNKDIVSQTDLSMRPYLLAPAVQSTLLINETVSLEMSYTGSGKTLKLVEPSGHRKDRYTTLAYLTYFVSLLDNQLLKEETEDDIYDEFVGSLFVA